MWLTTLSAGWQNLNNLESHRHYFLSHLKKILLLEEEAVVFHISHPVIQYNRVANSGPQLEWIFITQAIHSFSLVFSRIRVKNILTVSLYLRNSSILSVDSSVCAWDQIRASWLQADGTDHYARRLIID